MCVCGRGTKTMERRRTSRTTLILHAFLSTSPPRHTDPPGLLQTKGGGIATNGLGPVMACVKQQPGDRIHEFAFGIQGSVSLILGPR